jgi:transposase
VLQLTPQMKILVATEPADFRKGIDGLAQICRAQLNEDPFSGTVFIFRNRRGTSIKALIYDSRGFWLCQKRLSKGKFRYWPSSGGSTVTILEAHTLLVLLMGGDPTSTKTPPPWRCVGLSEAREKD